MWRDEEVRETVKSSKVYMIGHRNELFFERFNFIPAGGGILVFRIKMGEIISPLITYNIRSELEHLIEDNDEIDLEIGPKLMRFTLNGSANVIKWFTPDIFLFLYWRKQINVNVYGDFDFRRFTNFELYYVGISKRGDSFSRLFDQAHHGRLKILTNAQTKNYGSRLTDELTIFMFDIDKININIFNTEDDLKQDMNYITDAEAVIADAEKAFIKLLKTEYNEVTYQNFPQSTDGLYNERLARYGYSIQEDITFYTDSIEFKGYFDLRAINDFILVEGDTAKVVKASDAQTED
ncbi:hypothetical protein [Paenibacillus massiliensis]|uniref:hypothetical protein n=1 Tax=Paenibacillus massiliensis TaxID=225917 RepID=UPI00046FBCEC|nr:hypothetical protein [Paenibacillus massiliensis]